MSDIEFQHAMRGITRSMSREFLVIGAVFGFIAGFIGSLVLQGVLS